MERGRVRVIRLLLHETSPTGSYKWNSTVWYFIDLLLHLYVYEWPDCRSYHIIHKCMTRWICNTITNIKYLNTFFLNSTKNKRSPVISRKKKKIWNIALHLWHHRSNRFYRHVDVKGVFVFKFIRCKPKPFKKI